MLIENQKIEVFWSNKIKSYYISKGYEYTKRNAPFLVQATDLFPGSKNSVKLVCDNCGSEFLSPFNSHYSRNEHGEKDLCRSCAALKGHNKTKKQRAKMCFDKLRSICNENEYELITKEEDYENSTMSIEFKCKKHGTQIMALTNLLGGHKCIDCSYESRGKNFRNSPDYVEQVINSINGNKLLNKEDYIGSNVRNLKVLCGKCGKHTFLVSFSDYYNVKVHQCRSCSSSESVGEKKIADYLDSCAIQYVREKKFDDCRDKRALPFDFYVPEYNLTIEFDGQHHYFDIWGTENFKRTQHHDKIKDQFCKDNGISMLRIPYWEGRNVDKLIGDKLSNILHR